MKNIKILFIALILVSISISSIFGVEARVIIMSPIARGSGTYGDPYVLHTNRIDFKLDISGENKEDCLYYPNMHMDGNRNCSIMYEVKDLSYNQAVKYPFSHTVNLPGWFYIRVDINPGSGYYIQDFEKYYMHVYVETPPINNYTQPYTPPANNQKPVEVIDILNVVSGAGKYGDPYIINSKTVKFRTDRSYDPNGFQDLQKGLFLWCIESHGNHPIYSEGGGRVMTEAETFRDYYDYQGVIFEQDLTSVPSNTGHYLLYFWMIDQWGVCNTSNPRIFQIDESATEPQEEKDIIPPAIPTGVKIEVSNGAL